MAHSFRGLQSTIQERHGRRLHAWQWETELVVVYTVVDQELMDGARSRYYLQKVTPRDPLLLAGCPPLPKGSTHTSPTSTLS